jgi:hypothetical protein
MAAQGEQGQQADEGDGTPDALYVLKGVDR